MHKPISMGISTGGTIQLPRESDTRTSERNRSQDQPDFLSSLLLIIRALSAALFGCLLCNVRDMDLLSQVRVLAVLSLTYLVTILLLLVLIIHQISLSAEIIWVRLLNMGQGSDFAM
jgi:hypothetical protein